LASRRLGLLAGQHLRDHAPLHRGRADDRGRPSRRRLLRPGDVLMTTPNARNLNPVPASALSGGGGGPSHPAERPVEPEHPMALMAESYGGDPEVMLECVVQEFARLGYGSAELLAMFRDPFFQAVYGLRELFGDEALERRVRQIVA